MAGDLVSADVAPNAHKLLTADELAERWQVDKAHVYRLTRQGSIPAVKLGRYYRYRLAAIDEFETKGGVAE
jgi:excisionase family DNA binding protein